MLLSLFVYGVVVIGATLYIFFGPRNALLAFVVGAGGVAILAAFAMRYPAILAMTNVRSDESRASSAAIIHAVNLTADPKAAAYTISRILGWILTVVFGAVTLLFAVFAIALTRRDELTSGLTGSGLLCGAAAAVTFIVWKYLARAGVT